MTDNERANKVYLARLKYGDGKPRKFIHELPLPKHDISVGRKTPKSELLVKLDRLSNATAMKRPMDIYRESNGRLISLDDCSEMVDVYVGNK